MAVSLADQILRKIGAARELYHRLILIVGPAGSGKTSALQEVSASTSAPLININLELSYRMLDLTERQRTLRLARLLDEIVGEDTGELILLDNIELLFDIHLKVDPLRLLQKLSRNKTVVATWNGEIRTEGRGLRTESSAHSSLSPQHSSLIYAVPGHPEYRRYPIRDLIIVSASSVQRHASGGRV